MDRIKGYGYADVGRLRGRGCAVPHLAGHAHETADVDILTVAKYLRVTPTEPQTLVWMVPGNEIVYSVKSNITWNIE